MVFDQHEESDPVQDQTPEFVGCNVTNSVLEDIEGIFGMLKRVCEEDAQLVKHLEASENKQFVLVVDFLEV